jgi:hypothetical protein
VRWLLAILVAAAVGSAAYAAGLDPEFVYVLRSVARHLAGSGF